MEPQMPPDPTQLDQKKPSSPAHASSELASNELKPEDFYFEGPYMVFTAAYHLKRGFCCNSNCRHCPYR